MNLLLLLSAMLSALTGVMTGARAEAPRQVASASIAVVMEAVAQDAKVGVRPTQGLPGIVAVGVMPLALVADVTGLPHPFEMRRRE